MIIKDGFSKPWFTSSNGTVILKAKQKYVKLKEPTKDEPVCVDIAFHYYNMNSMEGYYVKSIG